MSQHRRLNPTVRPPRRKRVPAYQVRNRQTASRPTAKRASSTNGHSKAATPRPQRHVSGTQEHRISGDTEAFDAVQAPTNQALRTTELETGTNGHAPDDDYADYLSSVEEAAARSRANQRASLAGSAAAIPESRVPLRGGARRLGAAPPAAGAGAGGSPPRVRRRTRNGRPEREPDPRPLLRRPKTWLVIVAMIAAASALVVVLYTLNLVKATYDAYNDMHVEPTPRTVFEVSPDGTPVAVPTEQVAASLPNWDSGDPFNIMLLGVDDRDGEDQPVRSDTMIVVRVDPTEKSVVMMSIPRDLYVWIPGFRHDKINAAYPLGEFHEVPGGGVALAAQTIEANFNIRIHYFVTVDFTGFRKIVDTIGGVVIDVPAAVKDDQYPTETYGLTRVYFPTGLQRMDGSTALRYVRTRHGDNDIARGERQHQLLLALRSQAINLGLITRAESLIRETGEAIRTDLNFNQLLALANLGRQIESENIQRVNLWEEGYIFEHWPEDEEDAFYFDADWDAVWALTTELFGTPTSQSQSNPPESPEPTAEATRDSTTPVTADPGLVSLDTPILVQNASTTDLIATGASEALTSAGFINVTPDNAIFVEPTSTIYDYSGDPDTAAYVANLLGIPESAIVTATDGEGIVVVLGEDYAPSSTP